MWFSCQRAISRAGVVFSVLFVVSIAELTGCGRSTEPVELSPTLSSIQQHVFDVHCAVSNCHRGAAPESQMNLESGRAYESLVNVRSVGLRDLFRVRPGQADSSYLIRKLTGEGIVGDQMPLAKAPLPDSVVHAIRTWIEQGASRH